MPGRCSPSAPHVEPGPGVPRHGQADQVGHRAAAHQQAARAPPGSRASPPPADHLPLDERRRLVVARDVRVHPRGQHLGEHRERRAGAHHPAPEARMDVADGIGQDVLAELRYTAAGSVGPARARLVERARASRPAPAATRAARAPARGSPSCRPPCGGRARGARSSRRGRGFLPCVRMIGGQAGRRAGGQAGRRAGGQAGRRAGGQAGRRAGGQAGSGAAGQRGRGAAGQRGSGAAGQRGSGAAGQRGSGAAPEATSSRAQRGTYSAGFDGRRVGPSLRSG